MLLLFMEIARAGSLADCDQTWPASRLKDLAQSAESNIKNMDEAGYLTTRDVLVNNLPCIREPLGGEEIGTVHLIMATAASIERKDANIAPSLAGLLVAIPGYQLPNASYPDGHPVRGLLSHAGLLARATQSRALARRDVGWFEVDGASATAAPTERAAVIQEIDSDGAVVETRYVWPGDELGLWAASTTPPVEVKTRPTKAVTARPPGKARVPLLVSAGVAAVGTGVLYGLARSNYETFYATEVSAEPTDAELAQLSALRDTTNGLTVGWIVAGVATLGLGVGVAVAW